MTRAGALEEADAGIIGTLIGRTGPGNVLRRVGHSVHRRSGGMGQGRIRLGGPGERVPIMPSACWDRGAVRRRRGPLVSKENGELASILGYMVNPDHSLAGDSTSGADDAVVGAVVVPGRRDRLPRLAPTVPRQTRIGPRRDASAQASTQSSGSDTSNCHDLAVHGVVDDEVTVVAKLGGVGWKAHRVVIDDLEITAVDLLTVLVV